jgi:hypothetical protein
VSRRASSGDESDDTSSPGDEYDHTTPSGDESDATSQSSVVPTGVVNGGKPGPPDFVPRSAGDVLSKYDKPSICRDSPPAHLRYRKRDERV